MKRIQTSYTRQIGIELPQRESWVMFALYAQRRARRYTYIYDCEPSAAAAAATA